MSNELYVLRHSKVSALLLGHPLPVKGSFSDFSVTTPISLGDVG